MDDELRRLALARVEAELDRLRAAGPAALAALAARAPQDAPAEQGLTVTTRVDAEDERLLVLVEAWRGRRTLATGGFAMTPDGRTSTPH
ncbi:MAG TPA: hypothetical protein VGJ32_12545 [Solirubrobacteraceae bacterium]|jgi:hypothetical protein